jgi:hypothetical protein
MLPMTQAFADGSTSSHAGGSVMQLRPPQASDGLAGSINLGPNVGNTLMTVMPQGSADPVVGSNAGNGVMMVNPQGAADPNTATNAGNGVMQLQPGQVASNGSASDNGAPANGNTNESDIVNKQVNLDTVWNNTNVTVDDVNGDVNGQASAVANAFQAVTMNNSIVDNNQYASGAAVGSDLTAQITNINGSVNMSNQVACNNADVSTDPAYTIVHSKQECAVGDPSQATNVFAAQVQNDVNVSGSVAANVYTEDTNAKYNYVNSQQINSSAVNSTTNVQAYNVGGTVNVSSSAVGNTAQVVHY